MQVEKLSWSQVNKQIAVGRVDRRAEPLLSPQTGAQTGVSRCRWDTMIFSRGGAALAETSQSFFVHHVFGIYNALTAERIMLYTF